MKVVALWLLLAVNALAYNPFPIKAYVQRGNGPLVEVPELAGKPDPDRTYRLWFTNMVYEAEGEHAWRVDYELDYDPQTKVFSTEEEAIAFTNDFYQGWWWDEEAGDIPAIITEFEITNCLGHAEEDDVSVYFEFDPEVKKTNNRAVIYLGVFDANTNNPSYQQNRRVTGMDFWYVPDDNVNNWDNMQCTIDLYAADNYSHRLVVTTKSWWQYDNRYSQGFAGTMFPTNRGDAAYLLPIDQNTSWEYGIKSFDESMGGVYDFANARLNINRPVYWWFDKNAYDKDAATNLVSITFPANRIRYGGWGNVAGYIDICGASILGDPSQELKIEQFDVDFTKGVAFVIEEWDNYEPYVETSGMTWDLLVRCDECPSCGEHWDSRFPSTYMLNTNTGVYTIPTEIHCRNPECNAILPIAKSVEEYEYQRTNGVTHSFCYAIHDYGIEQVNYRFVISVPAEWDCGWDINTREYSYDGLGNGGLALWMSMTPDGDSTLIDGDSNLHGYTSPQNSTFWKRWSNDYKINCSGWGCSNPPRVKDITPQDYNPLRRLLVINGSYMIVTKQRGNPYVEMAYLGHEPKQAFFHFTYFHP